MGRTNICKVSLVVFIALFIICSIGFTNAWNFVGENSNIYISQNNTYQNVTVGSMTNASYVPYTNALANVNLNNYNLTNVNNFQANGNLNVTGNTTINNYYGEMWNKSDTGFVHVDLVTIDVYVQVTNLSAGLLNGITLSNSNLTVTLPGVYKINTVASITVNANSEFGLKVFVNTIGQDNCYSHIHTTPNDAESMGITCLLRLNSGDKIGLYIDDHANPVQDPEFVSANVDILRVGN